jgi:hypothetical protein
LSVDRKTLAGVEATRRPGPVATIDFTTAAFGADGNTVFRQL